MPGITDELHIGDLRHRVVFQRNTPTQDALGTPVDSWATLRTCWAKVEPLDGRKLEFAKQLKGEVTHQIAVRWFDGLTLADRMLLWDEYYQIDTILTPEEWSYHMFIGAHKVVE